MYNSIGLDKIKLFYCRQGTNVFKTGAFVLIWVRNQNCKPSQFIVSFFWRGTAIVRKLMRVPSSV